VANPARPTAAEEARTIAASTNTGTLASLTSTGDPWASFVTYGLLAGDPRASIAVVAPATDSDPLANGRITLAGVVEQPTGDEWAAARAAHVAAVPAAKYYVDYSDFALWVLRVHRVRWVGGYGRMDSATGQAYRAAAPDPVAPQATRTIAHLNADHAQSLVVMARAFGGFPDTVSAVCTGADRYGLDLKVTTERGIAYTRVGYPSPIGGVEEMRSATADLVQQARAT
jgi:putative heme iron utilization protein